MNQHVQHPLPEHDFEPIFGLPEALPAGEHIRWQGQPDWRDLARSLFHVRKLVVYFALLLALRLGVQIQEGVALASALNGVFALAVLAAVAIGLLSLMAWLMARATSYTITNRRLVIRSGVAVSLAVNLPFSHVVSADFRERKNGFGDIPVLFDDATRPSWIILWPHVRPWQFGRVQPMLRALPEAAVAAGILARALREHAQQEGTQLAPARAHPAPPSSAAVAHPATGQELGHV